jgi:early secretory antigenic target protein ESAT-6
MTLIKVSFTALDAGAGDIRTTYGNLQTQFDELQRMVNELLPTWDGTAREAYLGVQQQWNQLNQTLNHGLQGIGTGVTQANTTFQDTERSLTGLWGGTTA